MARRWGGREGTGARPLGAGGEGTAGGGSRLEGRGRFPSTLPECTLVELCRGTSLAEALFTAAVFSWQCPAPAFGGKPDPESAFLSYVPDPGCS